MNKEKNFVSAVVYVHNAEERIKYFLTILKKIMEENFEYSEIICVNDFSTDNSVQLIREISKEVISTSISLINMSSFHGMELAMNAGIDLSIGDFVFEFDSTEVDFEPEMIMKIYKHALQGFDIVSASSDRKERRSSQIFYKIFNYYSDADYKMSTESFRILSRRVINRISSMNKTVPYRKAIYSNCGLKTDNLKYISQSATRRVLFDSKEKKYRSKLAVESLILFTGMGYSFSKLMTIIMMIVSLFMGGYSIGIYLTSTPVAGWSTIMLFLSVSFFGLFGILTIIIKYLQLLVDMVFKRKHYSFESIEKLTK